MEVSSLKSSVNTLDCFSQMNKITNIGIMEMPKPARNPQHQPWPPLRCPRCNSTNTKFCYYNNYSKSQPRFLCKACRRHWTEGGTLRDVPVGGGRKNKRTKQTAGSSETATASTSMTNYTSSINNNSSVIQQLLSGNPSSSLFPDLLRQVLLRTPQQAFPLPVSASTPSKFSSANFDITSSMIGSRHTAGTNLGSYSSGLNAPNFSLSGYAETGLSGFGLAPPVQTGAESWGAWDDEMSELVNLEGNLPSSEGC